MESQLALLRFACQGEDVAGLRPGSLVQSVLVALLDGRDVEPLRARFHQLGEEPVPPRADNRLRHVASLQAAADLLDAGYEQRLSRAEIDAAIGEVAGESYLWPAFVDLAVALSLRVGDRDHARALTAQRLKAPLGDDVPTLTQLLHVASAAGADSQSSPELGYLGAQAALSMVGTSRTATALALATVHGSEGFADGLGTQARAWDVACAGVERGPAQWSLDRDAHAVRLTVKVRGDGPLHACAGWALEDLVYRWPQHIDRMLRREVPVNEVQGAKTRRAVLDAVSRGGVEAVAELHGVTLASDDIAALAARQQAGLAWVRANHAAMPAQASGIRIANA